MAAGVCANLAGDDVLLSTHRGHGHTLAKGADPLAMMRELFGREGGNCGGKGGSMHIADFKVGMLGANGVVAANIVIAAGAAHAIKLKREKKIVCCIFGDGAINRGPFLEGLNWARVFGLPVLFVCEDNGFAAMTRTKSMTAGDGASARARAIGLAAEEIDGNDVLAVDLAAGEAVRAVREDGAPRFLHLHTYRLTGHTGADPATYRPKEEVEKRWRDDPIARAASLLEGAGARGDALTADRNEAFAEMRAGLRGREGDALSAGRARLRRRPGRRRPAPGGLLMAVMSYAEASRVAIAEEMRRDPTVWAVGEDLGRGGVFGQYKGLAEEFGPERVSDAPISETCTWAKRSAPP